MGGLVESLYLFLMNKPAATTFFILVASAGCARQVYAPPTHFFPLESAAVAGKKQVVVNGDVAVAGELFGAGITAGNGRVRYGVGTNLELVASASVAHVEGFDNVPTKRGIYAARVGVKTQLAPWLSIAGGGGGGYAPAGGGYTGLDASVIAAYENCYVVPFASAGVYGGLPLAPRPIPVDDALTDTPKPTVGLGGSLGVRFLLGSCRKRNQVSLLLGTQAMAVRDRDDSALFAGFSGGIQIAL